MADVEPLRALHYDLSKVGGLQPVAAPPYDVIDAAQRAELLGRSPYNVVEVDLPQGDGDPYAHAAEVLAALERRGHRRPRRAARAVGARAGLHRARTASRARATASSRACGSRTTAPAGSARTSARTPARRRTGCGSRARRARTSRRSSASTTTRPTRPGAPSSRTSTARRGARSPTRTAPSTGSGGSTTRPPSRPSRDALAGTELLIADGHHRYETARVYQQEERAPTTC